MWWLMSFLDYIYGESVFTKDIFPFNFEQRLKMQDKKVKIKKEAAPCGKLNEIHFLSPWLLMWQLVHICGRPFRQCNPFLYSHPYWKSVYFKQNSQWFGLWKGLLWQFFTNMGEKSLYLWPWLASCHILI